MIRETFHALAACLVTLVLCSVIYPAAVWGVAWLCFPHQAAGSLIERNGKVIGSRLIAQPFASEGYFHPRPSAVDYKADATGGSNLGTKNPDLHAKIKDRAAAFHATTRQPVPVDLVMASGSGMDPDISPEAAYFQEEVVAKARKVPTTRIHALIDAHINHSGAIIGAPPRVNVLELNLALDDDLAKEPAAAPTTETAPQPVPDKPVPSAANVQGEATTNELAAVRTQVETVSQQLVHLSKKVDAIPARLSPDSVRRIALRVDRIAADTAPLAERINAAEQSLRSVRSTLEETRDLLKAQREKAEASHAATPLSTNVDREGAVTPPEVNLGPALQDFRAGRYAQAAKALRSLTQTHADDARTWYLAAVANGLATNVWDGETAAMVARGAERERAGTPSAVDIDAALEGLTPATGRDWVEYYRKHPGK